ncbi:helix-turn-helix domain-containing protein [Youxingia wuxianensis]|uniref:Stage 0 sporulation protein A homolog n=1 Tax=Youxingia wuxianensis TaxID=2763678 RepID=A0A926EMC9_9FIRM|nr:helix-turn-helix domain-containing protein [Youxingia wuxianensis]MBC8586113.1 helix-turn-helix domain-containing protein [Youxingia wuxianensis]
MKALIVDDEHHVIDAIRLLVPWEELGINQVLTANSVAQAKKCLQEQKPEIAIADIIINSQTGLEFMDYISANKYATKVIAVSGHSDFDFVRTMLLKGSVDYLLKPLERDRLISAVKKAVDAWNLEHQKALRDKDLQLQIDTLSLQHQRFLFPKLLAEDTFESAYAELSRLNFNFADAKECLVLYFDLFFYPTHSPEFSEALHTLMDHIRIDLENNALGSFFYKPQDPNGVLILIYREFETAFKMIYDNLKKMHEETSFPLYLGQSQRKSFPDQLKEACQEAELAFGEADCSSKSGRILSYQPEFGLLELSSILPLENKMFSALLIGEKNGIKDSVAEWIGEVLPKKEIPFYLIKNTYFYFRRLYEEWVSYFSKRYLHFAHEESLPFSYPLVLDEDNRFSKERMCELLAEELYHLSDEIHSANHSENVIYEVADYLEVNYKQKFNQAEYSALFHISKEYLSRKFKETFGMGMVSYLNEIRIKKAQELIVETNHRIRDISFEVGYDDEKYFTKLFKKMTSMTPSEYRIYIASKEPPEKSSET